MSAPGRTITLLAAVTIIVAIAGYTLQPRRPAGARHHSTTARGTPRPAAIIIDADPHGTIMLDEQGRYAGVRRDGTVAWREPAGAHAFGVVSCLTHCPDAVLSASLDAINSADIADPEPRLVVDGRWRRLARLDGHKRRILTASGVDQFLLATGDRNQWWLEIHDNGAAARRVRVGGFNSSWQESADGRHGFAVTSAPGGNQARWFHARRQWLATGGQDHASCRPQLLRRARRPPCATARTAPRGPRPGRRPAAMDRPRIGRCLRMGSDRRHRRRAGPRPPVAPGPACEPSTPAVRSAGGLTSPMRRRSRPTRPPRVWPTWSIGSCTRSTRSRAWSCAASPGCRRRATTPAANSSQSATTAARPGNRDHTAPTFPGQAPRRRMAGTASTIPAAGHRRPRCSMGPTRTQTRDRWVAEPP